MTSIRARPLATVAFLHGHQNQRCLPSLQLPASAQASLRPSNPGIINLYFAPQRLACQVDHCASEFMQHHPRCFVASQRELPLQKKRRDAALVGGHQVGSPEPDRQRRLRVMQDRPSGQRNLVSTIRYTASVEVPPIHKHGDFHSADRQSHPASGMRLNTVGRPPPWRTSIGIPARFSETAGEARPYTTSCGLLKQPDKHKSLSFRAIVNCGRLNFERDLYVIREEPWIEDHVDRRLDRVATK